MSYVDSALKTLKRPVTGKDLSVESRFGPDGAPSDPYLAALQRDLARLNLRRLINQHGCDGSCDRPEHARDVAAGVELLEILDLTYRPAAAEKPEPEPAPPPVEVEAGPKRCSACGETKDRAEFSKDRRQTDGLRCQCKTCSRKYYNDARDRRKYQVKAIPKEKLCPSCGELKPAEQYWRDRSTGTGLMSSCKTCKGSRNAHYKKGVAA